VVLGEGLLCVVDNPEVIQVGKKQLLSVRHSLAQAFAAERSGFPLRQRKEDIPTLIQHFGRQVCAQNGWKRVPFTPEAISALQAYTWPGNIRELRNVVERLLLLADEEIDSTTVELALPYRESARYVGLSDGTADTLAAKVQEFERATVLAELQRNHRHITNTARALGLERSHLYKKCQQLGIDLKAE
jgi:DNA-binding NtrC family response regulator